MNKKDTANLRNICLLFMLLLLSCVTPKQAQRRVTKVRQTIPEMLEAELLVEGIDTASGSQNNCEGARYSLVYGSNQTFDDVLSFYQRELLAAGWEDASDTHIVPVFRKDKSYSLAVIQADQELVLTFLDKESQEIVAEHENRFLTLFLVEITFTTCPTG